MLIRGPPGTPALAWNVFKGFPPLSLYAVEKYEIAQTLLNHANEMLHPKNPAAHPDCTGRKDLKRAVVTKWGFHFRVNTWSVKFESRNQSTPQALKLDKTHLKSKWRKYLIVLCGSCFSVYWESHLTDEVFPAGKGFADDKKDMCKILFKSWKVFLVEVKYVFIGHRWRFFFYFILSCYCGKP